MRAGKLRNRVQLQTATVAQNEYGDPGKTWTTFKTVWARIRPVSGSEFLEAQRVESELTHEITIRKNDLLTTADRVKHKTKIFNIEAIVPDEKFEVQQIIMAVEELG